MSTPADHLPLTEPVYRILLALAGGDRHGYAMMQDVEQSSDGRVRLGPGTLYGAIKRLRESGLIAEADAPAPDADARRRHYRLTPFGRQVLVAETQRMAALVREARSKSLVAAEELA